MDQAIQTTPGTVNPSRATAVPVWEMNYITRKFSVSEAKVRKAVATVGNSRMKVESYIRAQQMKG